MKQLLLSLALTLALMMPGAAQADPSVSLEDDPIFSDAADSTFTSDSPGLDSDEGGTLEQAAERFSQSCYQDLGPASACFEDYEASSCTATRSSCRTAGHYSR